MEQLVPVIVILLVLVLVAFRSKTTHFECPNCGCRFKVPGWKYAVAPHIGFRRFATCPQCLYRGMMPTVNDPK